MGEDVVDKVLERAGRWGKFQLRVFLCLLLATVFSAFSLSYIFTARDIKYRCYIPECEKSPLNASYNPDWLLEFVPFQDKSPSRCLRYASVNTSISRRESPACSKESVLQNMTVRCDQFVYQKKEITIVHDFNIICSENLWKLTIIGTLSVTGELVCLSYSGFISDIYGRKTLLILSMLLSTMVGLLRSFAANYYAYAIFEFLDTAFSGCTYGAAFVLAMEMLESKHRTLGNFALSVLYALGCVFVGLAAWFSPSWRIMLRILYTPGLLSIIFIWAIPESLRWLLSKKNTKEAKKVIKQIASENNREIMFSSISLLGVKTGVDPDGRSGFKESIRNRRLLIRMVHCSFTWICCTFLYFGLTIHSTAMSENVYLSFIFAVMVELPGYIIYYYGNEKIGRRLMMFFSLVSAGLSCLAVGIVKEEMEILKLALFLWGKCSSTVAFTVLFSYTTEIFPTCSRHTMFSICSMFGRFGSMLAPQIPLLARVSRLLPLLTFGGIGCISGTLALLFPETLNTKLPDTIEQAVNIGKKIETIKEEEEEALS
ncbi:unnamed protein product [Acanthoscelides obtectus]|uniref:Major facilitator superfamily (MFS) profile domain-containing protein n=1 Tax=Acanthoscelides obtectus TaxID=200917 RepID=A0A9P0M2J6_ACAOB|nr:unnamed protein product [Acanthoscelides obtectus]CAK1665062.1 Solute carrier family 22 member 3 [Acanthoscelides obtectus]